MSRHTFAVRLLEEGVDIYTVSKLLGHKDLETTMAYAKATDGMRRSAVDKLPEIHIAPKP
jgi:integrase/recombinase XerD